MPENLVIDKVIVEGLRGFNTPRTIDLDGAHALISGKIGTGKTSTLCAIEWALFGDIAYVKCSESKTQAEHVNMNKSDQKAKVQLQLKGPDGEYTIQREKTAKKRNHELIFITPDETYEGEDAETHIFKIFGTFDDFHRSVYLHQEAIRDIITEDPEERDSALDRLFGLELTRELVATLPLSQARNECEGLVNDKGRLAEKIKGATEQVQHEYKKAVEEALDLGLTEDEFNLIAVCRRYNELLDNLARLKDNCDIGEFPKSIDEKSQNKEIVNGIKKIKVAIIACRKHMIESSKLDQLRSESNNVQTAIEKYNKAKNDLALQNNEYNTKRNEWGTIEKIQLKEDGLKSRDITLKANRDAVDSTSTLIADSISYFTEQKTDTCPVCGNKISQEEIVSNLENKVNQVLKQQISAIDEERKQINEQLFECDSHKKDLSKIYHLIENAKLAYETDEKELQTLLKVDIKEDALIAHANDILSSYNAKISEAKNELKTKNSKFDELGASTDKCTALVVLLDKEAAYEKLSTSFADETSKMEQLDKKIKKMAELIVGLREISSAISKTQIELAREYISKGEEQLTDYYNQICGHPYYSSIRIDTREKNVRGVQRNTYKIIASSNERGKETQINTRFSTGQMNCTALSLFLSLSSAIEKNSKFIMLDDPSQGLDAEHKNYLIDVLNDVAQRRQLIIATQDGELIELLDNKFKPTEKYVSLNYSAWNKDGPEIKLKSK